MPRASRHYLPGYIWHLTHRCHRQQFLLKFIKDRRAWMGWPYEARQRFGLCVLNYAVTSNHYLCAAAHNTWFGISAQA